MNFDYSSGYPEMSCFDYNAIETYFQDLTGQIKVDKSITNWTLFIEISLGGAIGKKEICIGKRGITYLADQGIRIKNYFPVKVVTNIFHPIPLLVFSDSYFLLLFYPSLVW